MRCAKMPVSDDPVVIENCDAICAVVRRKDVPILQRVAELVPRT